MKNKLKLLIVLAVVINCNGHLRILGDILSSAHDRIHSTVENVAGTVLGGLSHGLNINVEGHVGVNGQRPGFKPHSRPEETVVVVIKEEDNDNNFRPPNNNFQRPHHNQYNNDYRPNNNPYGFNNQRPNYNVPNNENNYINGPPNRPNNGNKFPDNQFNNNNYNPNYNQGGNNHGPPPNRYPENNYHGNNYNENNNNNNGYRPANPGYNQVKPITPENRPEVSEEPPTEFETKRPEKPYHDVTTKKPIDDDAPLFIPLTNYNYGGDKINITAPKRETNNDNKKADEDEDFGIDVRIRDI